MKIIFFLGGVVCLIVDHYIRSGLITGIGLAAILTAVSNDNYYVANDWRTKYRPG